MGFNSGFKELILSGLAYCTICGDSDGISKMIRPGSGISKYSHASQSGWQVTVSDFRNLG